MLAVCFYIFAITALFCCAFVVLSQRMVHCLFFLILAYLNVSILLILMGAEFLAMLLAVVYVGAVAVLFLFVVMMVDMQQLPSLVKQPGRWPVLILAASVFAAEILYLLIVFFLGTDAAGQGIEMKISVSDLGRVLYTDYIFYFQFGGLILLFAMIGAVALTKTVPSMARNQNVGEQISRPARVHHCDVSPGSALKQD